MPSVESGATSSKVYVKQFLGSAYAGEVAVLAAVGLLLLAL